MKHDKRPVKVWNPEARRIIRMPMHELTPGFLPLRGNWNADDVFVEAAWLVPQWIRQHNCLPPLLHTLMSNIQAILSETFFLSISEWQAEIMKGENLAKKIPAWIFIAFAYTEFTKDRDFTYPERWDYLRLIIAHSFGPPGFAPDHISEMEMAAAVDAFRAIRQKYVIEKDAFVEALISGKPISEGQ